MLTSLLRLHFVLLSTVGNERVLNGLAVNLSGIVNVLNQILLHTICILAGREVTNERVNGLQTGI